jgi:hypothetical protein
MTAKHTFRAIVLFVVFVGPVMAAHTMVDDMESYCEHGGCGNEIWNTWRDGFSNWTGSELILGVHPNAPVHSGSQSMVYWYDNMVPWDGRAYWSVIDTNTVNLQVPSDWADYVAMVLFFYGDPYNDANDTEQMFVGLEDSRGPGSYVEVRYGDRGEDMNDIKVAEWHQWYMPLQDFNDLQLEAVERIHIGFGSSENWSTPGGYGRVFFDDIQLHWPACSAFPAGDVNLDCKVDFKDVAIVGQTWLQCNLDPPEACWE